VDPLTNALHTSFLRGPRRLAPRIRASRRALALRAPVLGPAALSPDEKRALLSDAVSLRDLHAAVWRLDDAERAALWSIAPERPVAG
jgi:membrane glycosyltransferase